MSEYYRHKKQIVRKGDIQLYIQKNIAISVRLNSIVLKSFDEKCKDFYTSRNEMINQLIRNWLFKNNVTIEPEEDFGEPESWFGEDTDKHTWKRI